jgi:hypothetical protein
MSDKKGILTTLIMSTEQPEISQEKIRILQLLAEYKYLTARQIWEKSGASFEGRKFTHTRVLLHRLKKCGLIKVERSKRERGSAGEYEWLLLRAGAKLINFEKFGYNYTRSPSRYQSEYRQLELHLEEMVDLAIGDWQLLKPFAYSAYRKLPDRTEQCNRLCQTVTWQVYQETGKLPTDVYGPHTLIVPRQANHHLAYLASNKKMVVLVLSRPRATERFWQERARQYRRLATKIQVYGVFPDEKQLELHEKVLAKVGLNGTTVFQVSELLSNFYEHS